MSYRIGQKLLIELADKIYEGEYSRENEHSIAVKNVTLHNSTQKFSGVIRFNKSEIVSLRTIENDLQETSDSVENDSSASESSDSKILLLNSEYIRLKDMSQNFIYMANADNRYIKAVEYLSKCESIAVAGLGGEYGRTSRIKLLVIASQHQVYIFDILNFKHIWPELKQLLESANVKKVVYDCRSLSDTLYKNHEVNLTNVFDVQIADYYVYKESNSELKMKTFRTLSECINSHLKLPSGLLGNSKEEFVLWTERPLCSKTKCKASMYAVYLLELRNVLEKEMLKNFYAAVDVSLNIAKLEENAIEAAKFLNDDIPFVVLKIE